jgi:AcrR family transcriptional regulator
MPRKMHARLDKNIVVQTAIQLVNREGMEALTLSSLAGELGIQTPSLYNHIDGLPGLQRELNLTNAKLLANRLSEVAIGKSGTDLFMELAQAFRAYVKEYPGLYMSTLRSSGKQPVKDEELREQEERIMKIGMAMMFSLGLQGDEAVHGLRAFRSMVHGFATLEVLGGFGMPLDCDKSFKRIVSALIHGLQQGA